MAGFRPKARPDPLPVRHQISVCDGRENHLPGGEIQACDPRETGTFITISAPGNRRKSQPVHGSNPPRCPPLSGTRPGVFCACRSLREPARKGEIPLPKSKNQPEYRRKSGAFSAKKRPGPATNSGKLCKRSGGFPGRMTTFLIANVQLKCPVVRTGTGTFRGNDSSCTWWKNSPDKGHFKRLSGTQANDKIQKKTRSPTPGIGPEPLGPAPEYHLSLGPDPA